MIVELYNHEKRTNSTRQPAGAGKSVNVRLKEQTSVNEPIFLFSTNATFSYNYLSWDGRYYYINNIVIVRDNLYELQCNIDVLATYKQQIQQTIAYVQFSSSNFNDKIIDTRLPTSATPKISKASKLLFRDGVTNLDLFSAKYSGYFLLNYVTSQPTVGGTGMCLINNSQLKSLMSQLTSTSFLNHKDIFRQFNQIFNCVLSCKYFPFTFSAPTNSAEILLGNYRTGITGKIPNSIYSYGNDITLPISYNDFRRSSQYVSILVYLPGYGFASINVDDLDSNTLYVNAYIDGITGAVSYNINNIFKCTTTITTDISIGTISQNNRGVVTGLAVAGASAIGGNPIGAIGGLASAGMSLVNSRSVGNVGSAGGISGLISPTAGDWRNITAVVVEHDVLTQPGNLTIQQGRPLNTVVSLGTLKGYVKTYNASVSTDNALHTETINNYLNGEGVYIE